MRLITFQINHAPVADAGIDQNAYAGADVQLQGSATDPDGDAIASWLWRFESVPAGSGAALSNPAVVAPTFTPDLPGDYVLSLVASDGTDASPPDFVTIHVSLDLPPVAVAAADVMTGTVPLSVQCDGTQSHDPEGQPLTYRWSFGDFTGSTEARPLHVYMQAGSFTVQLTVTDVKGQTSTDTLAIEVLPPVNHPPVASPTAMPVSGVAPLSVRFAAMATDADGDSLTYAWDFGDTGNGGTSPLANPTHVYANTGTYVAWLTVSDGKASTTASLTISVNPQFRVTVLSGSARLQPKKATGDVQVEADLVAPVPAPSDVVAVYFDGAQIVAAPFSSFTLERGQTLVYVYKDRHVYAKLDFAARRLVASNALTNLSSFDTANGVAIEVHLGDRVAVESVTMQESRNRLTYVRTAPVIDQAQTITDHLGLSGGSLWGQTFVPAASNLAQVDLLFMATNVPPEGITSTVGLYRDITQPPIATADAVLTPPAPGVLDITVSFRFSPPVPLEPGTSYTIGWYGPPVSPSGAVMSWNFTYQNPYASGEVVNYANVPLNPPADFVFTTYYAP